ncbi:MAG: bifunctional trypsin-like peptidase domain-containing/SEL1-like repeat protein, partial [Alphaproteobacteria bacterium]|nr:bifunctional trypsin-like peptidase domain-containing/SEL1-like repeat protein [Alphaproteobacteria bacterium]
MKRHTFVITFAVLSSTLCQAAIPSVGVANQDLIDFGAREKFSGVKQFRGNILNRSGGAQWRDCSAVKVIGNQGFSTYLTAAHCFKNVSEIFMDHAPVHSYFIHPLYETDPRYDIGAFAIKGESSEAEYLLWQGSHDDLFISTLIYSGYGVMEGNTIPLRQAGYVSVHRIEDGIRLEFKGATAKGQVSIHSTTSGDSGGGLFIEDKDGAQRLVGILIADAPAKSHIFTSLSTLIDENFRNLISKVFSSAFEKPYTHKDLSKEAYAMYLPPEEMKRKIVQVEGQAGRKHALGAKYALDLAATQGDERAQEWVEKAANQGHAPAQSMLGEMYAEGIDCSQSYVKAVEWYEKAANQGYAPAQHSLGKLYFNGRGVERDYVRARKLWEKAASQGNADAQDSLGAMYFDGRGVAQDYVRARELWEKAANQGHASAQDNLGAMYYSGNGVTQDYVKARELWEKAASQGNVDAQYSLGTLYFDGQSVERDYVRARKLWEKAASQGNVDAQYSLGTLYFDGQSVERDYVRARKLW